MGTNGDEDIETKDFRDSKEEFGDLITFGETMKHANSDSLENSILTENDFCGICNNSLVVPRMLFCLHGFCEECLDKKLIGEGGDAGTPETSIVCPICHHPSKVGTRKLNSLPLDVTRTNISDVSTSTVLHCTSCTAKEIAKSRCNTCHNLLCLNCDTAHHYMRCFESHKVVTLDDMRKDGQKITIHKALVCDVHKNEIVNYYCNTCLTTLCTECIKNEHKGHAFEAVMDSVIKVRQELQALLDDCKSKVEILIQASNGLNNSLEELDHQHCSAKDLINETYQSYKAMLEKYKEEALDQLKILHRERELKVMMENDRVGKSISNMEDALKFTSHLLDDATAPEMLYLRKVVVSRLNELSKRSPKPERVYSIVFQSDSDAFEKAVRENFGKFRTENSMPKQSSPVPLLPNLQSLNINEINTNVSSVPITNGCSNSLSNSSPISLPMSMQSSFDGEIGNNVQNFTLTQSPPLAPPVNPPTLQGFSSIAEYNLTQLATLAETSPTNNAPSSPQLNIADLLNNDTACKNLALLAKLGLGNDSAPPNGNILVRSTSAASLTLTNNMINGFGGVSNSTSPILSTPDDIPGPDPLSSILPSTSNNTPSAITRSNKVSPMQIRWKFGQLGPSKGHFNSPHGFCLGLEEDIIVADTNNHRIQVFEKSGTFKFQFGIPGKDEGQLWYPRKVAVMRSSGKYVVCDRGNERSRMQIFTKSGHFLKKIAIRYIDIVAGLAVSTNGEIVAVDSVSPTVFIIGESGELLRWFDCSDYMREPSDIAIHGKEFYVCDFKGHNVVVFNEAGNYIRRIGYESVTNFPNGIDISDAGDVLIGDSHGNRFHVAVFSREGALVSEFECPYVKVSRCCGLKITSEGYVVTLAKNNHHVLVLNTLYIM